MKLKDNCQNNYQNQCQVGERGDSLPLESENAAIARAETDLNRSLSPNLLKKTQSDLEVAKETQLNLPSGKIRVRVGLQVLTISLAGLALAGDLASTAMTLSQYDGRQLEAILSALQTWQKLRILAGGMH